MKSKVAKATATKLVQRAQAGETAGTIKDTAANWANVASQAAKLWYIALIVAIVAALIALIWALVTAEDAETKALKAANEQLEASKNAYDRARDAAANFKEEVSDYEDALNGLKELTAGTEEMADAVEEANKKARKLIETYGLFGQYSYGANGEIIFDEGVLDGVERSLNSKEKQAEVNYYGAKINQIEAQSNYDAKQNTSSFGTYTTAREYNEVAIPGGRGYTKKEYLNYLDPETTTARSYVAKSSSPRSMAQVNG
jgi:chromosome segregation ATPase